MKKALVIFVSLFSMMSAKAQYYHYDVNNDGFINMTDVTLIINRILNRPNGYLECPDNNHPHMIDLGADIHHLLTVVDNNDTFLCKKKCFFGRFGK